MSDVATGGDWGAHGAYVARSEAVYLGKGLPQDGVMAHNGPQTDTESTACHCCACTGVSECTMTERRCDGS
jgi:hypothetical protein